MIPPKTPAQVWNEAADRINAEQAAKTAASTFPTFDALDEYDAVPIMTPWEQAFMVVCALIALGCVAFMIYQSIAVR